MKKIFSRIAILLLGLFLAAPAWTASADDRPVIVLSTENIVSGHDKAIVTADQSTYNPDTARYTLHGNVSIQFGSRVLLTDEAKISTQTLQVWTKNNTRLHEGELCFRGGAVYAELSGGTIWFFGPNCSLKRPGLAIHSDNMSYCWNTHIAVFDGHVLCIQKDKQKTADHLEFDLSDNELH